MEKNIENLYKLINALYSADFGSLNESNLNENEEKDAEDAEDFRYESRRSRYDDLASNTSTIKEQEKINGVTVKDNTFKKSLSDVEKEEELGCKCYTFNTQKTCGETCEKLDKKKLVSIVNNLENQLVDLKKEILKLF